MLMTDLKYISISIWHLEIVSFDFKSQHAYLKNKGTRIAKTWYLMYKIPSFTIPKHVNSPISLWPNLVPYCGKTNLISWSKAVNFVEPKTCKKIGYWNVLSYYHTTFWNICNDSTILHYQNYCESKNHNQNQMNPHFEFDRK